MLVERRLLAWVVASTAFLFIYIALNNVFGPPRPVQPAPDQAAAVADGDEVDGPAEGDPSRAADAPEAEIDDDIDLAAAPPAAESWHTLGSFDPSTGYHMLVYVNSRGAGIHRIELTERKENGRLKYRRVDVRGGYAGYMALADDDLGAGVRAQVIGPGTPVDVAVPVDSNVPPGLRAGDLIREVDGTVVTTHGEFEEQLIEHDPGDTVRLVVERTPDSVVNLSDSGEAPIDANLAAPKSDADADEVDPAAAPKAPTTRLEFDVVLSEHPLDLVRISSRGGADEIVGNFDRPSCLMTLQQINSAELRVSEDELASIPSQHRKVWEIAEAPEGIEDAQRIEFRSAVSATALERVKAAPVELIHSYALEPGSYILDQEVGIENLGEQPQRLAYRLEGPNGITLEGWWYSNKISPNFGGAGARDVIYHNEGSGDVLWGTYSLIKEARDKKVPPAKVLVSPDDPESERNLNYIGVDAQYFTVAYVPQEMPAMTQFKRAAATLACNINAIPKHKERAANTSFYVDSQTVEVAPGEQLRHKVRMFAGPKQTELLAQYGLEDAVYYGWFSMISKPLQSILHVFNRLTSNFAVAIFLLTVLVRALLFPLGRRAAAHAQKMQELAPELKKIAEKYKDDMEGRLKAQRELQQRVGFNPLSGCLPMFIQLPIFIGLYRCLSVDIELRQAALSSSLRWCSNLAAPDMLAYWGDWLWDYLSGRGTGWLGPYFNILPMAVMALFLLQQKMFMPPATDEQTAMTQKVMTIMTIFMGFFFFRVPSGLCIYFITSSLWGICERKLVKKTLPETSDSGRPALANASASPNGQASSKPAAGKSLGDRIRERMGNEPPPTVPPAKRPRPKSKKKR